MLLNVLRLGLKIQAKIIIHLGKDLLDQHVLIVV